MEINFVLGVVNVGLFVVNLSFGSYGLAALAAGACVWSFWVAWFIWKRAA